jgi:hypothetical protein
MFEYPRTCWNPVYLHASHAWRYRQTKSLPKLLSFHVLSWPISHSPAWIAASDGERKSQFSPLSMCFRALWSTPHAIYSLDKNPPLSASAHRRSARTFTNLYLPSSTCVGLLKVKGAPHPSTSAVFSSRPPPYAVACPWAGIRISLTYDRLFINAPPDSLGCTKRAYGEPDGVGTSANTRRMNASNSSSEWKRVTWPVTTCSTRPSEGDAPLDWTRNCTTKARLVGSDGCDWGTAHLLHRHGGAWHF